MLLPSFCQTAILISEAHYILRNRTVYLALNVLSDVFFDIVLTHGFLCYRRWLAHEARIGGLRMLTNFNCFLLHVLILYGVLDLTQRSMMAVIVTISTALTWASSFDSSIFFSAMFTTINLREKRRIVG
jgi:hypothetical protein